MCIRLVGKSKRTNEEDNEENNDVEVKAQREGMGDVGSARYEPAFRTSPMPDH